MKTSLNKTSLVFLFISFLLLSLYRVVPFRLPGFAPQIAIAFFSGFLFSHNKKAMFLVPLLSLFLSDLLYAILYQSHLTNINGFYGWSQPINYLFIILIAFFGISARIDSLIRWVGGNCLGATAYYLVSNTFVWLVFGGYARPHTWGGYLQCMNEALPFYVNSLSGTVVFCLLLRGIYQYAFSAQLRQIRHKNKH